MGHIRRFCPSRHQKSVGNGEGNPESVLVVSKVGGRSAGAHAPTPPDPAIQTLEDQVKNCLDEVVKLVMKRHFHKDLATARKKKKRKEKKERDKRKKRSC